VTRAFGTTRLQKAKRPAAVIVVGTIGHAVGTSRGRPITDIGLFVVERVLLLLIVAELLHTLQVVDLGGRILVEPFLFIGLIAVVRRVLVLMAEAEGGRRAENTGFLVQIGALGSLALAIHLLRAASRTPWRTWVLDRRAPGPIAIGMTAGTQVALPTGVTAEGDGIAIGETGVRVDAYIDFLCPFCRQFEAASGDALKQMVAAQLITLVYHPLGFLDRLSTTAYSSRASAASGCASDGGRFVAFKDALFAVQPEEGGPGLSDEQLVAVGEDVGLDVDTFGACVMAGRYLPWAAFVTERALERGVSGTPSVYVAGTPVPANARTIAAAVAAIAR